MGRPSAGGHLTRTVWKYTMPVPCYPSLREVFAPLFLSPQAPGAADWRKGAALRVLRLLLLEC